MCSLGEKQIALNSLKTLPLFNPLYTKGGGIYLLQKWVYLQERLPSLFFTSKPYKTMYIFIKCIKNTFMSIIEIMTHVKIVTSQA